MPRINDNKLTSGLIDLLDSGEPKAQMPEALIVIVCAERDLTGRRWSMAS
jgi:hypothetical protein